MQVPRAAVNAGGVATRVGRSRGGSTRLTGGTEQARYGGLDGAALAFLEPLHADMNVGMRSSWRSLDGASQETYSDSGSLCVGGMDERL